MRGLQRGAWVVLFALVLSVACGREVPPNKPSPDDGPPPSAGAAAERIADLMDRLSKHSVERWYDPPDLPFGTYIPRPWAAHYPLVAELAGLGAEAGPPLVEALRGGKLSAPAQTLALAALYKLQDVYQPPEGVLREIAAGDSPTAACNALLLLAKLPGPAEDRALYLAGLVEARPAWGPTLNALYALDDMGPAAAAAGPVLVRVLEASLAKPGRSLATDEWEPWMVIPRTLVRVAPETPGLLETLLSFYGALRQESDLLRALGLDPERAMPHVLQAIREGQHYTRSLMLMGLVDRPSEHVEWSLPGLVGLIRDGRDYGVDQLAAAVIRIAPGAPETQAAALELLESKNPWARRGGCIIVKFGKFAGDEAQQALDRCRQDPDPAVRQIALLTDDDLEPPDDAEGVAPPR